MITRSLCPVCYKEITGDIAFGEFVYMVKHCPEHGIFTGMIDRDPAWYALMRSYQAPEIYKGYVVDITPQCNISCRICYHDRKGYHRSVDRIVDECKDNADKAPFILSGGEPTIHPDLIEIIHGVRELGEVHLLTNGVKFAADPKLCADAIEAGLRLWDNNVNIGLSFHPESAGADIQCLELFRSMGVKIVTALALVDEVTQLDGFIETFRAYRDVISALRIRAAENVWNEKGVIGRVFISDMVKRLQGMGPVSIITALNNKPSYVNVLFEDMHVIFVSGYDKGNVDLNDINCAPWYKAKDGTINNIVTSLLINEGMAARGE